VISSPEQGGQAVYKSSARATTARARPARPRHTSAWAIRFSDGQPAASSRLTAPRALKRPEVPYPARLPGGACEGLRPPAAARRRRQGARTTDGEDSTSATIRLGRREVSPVDLMRLSTPDPTQPRRHRAASTSPESSTSTRHDQARRTARTSDDKVKAIDFP